MDRMRGFCPSFMEALQNGKVRFSENQSLVNVSTSEELPFNFGRGGPQAIFRQQLVATTITQLLPNLNATLASENSIMLTTFYDDRTARHDTIDMEADEKRERDDNVGQAGRRVRDDEPAQLTPLAPI